MGKKKAQQTGEENIDDEEKELDPYTRIVKEIEKDFGKNIIISGSELIERPKVVIPVSPAINQITGGGVPEGSWFVLVGKYKCGKTLTALHFAKKCQEERFGGRKVYFLNVEGRLKRRDILGIPGFNSDKLHIVESTEDRILTSQEYLSIAEKILKTEKKCILIIDSISQLCDEREMIGGVGTETRGAGARWIAQFTNQMSNIVPVKNHIIVSILHITSNTSGKGSPLHEKGGNAIQYQADVKLVAQGQASPWVVTEGATPFGQIVTWKCTSSALCSPLRSCDSYIRYGEGIDEIHELILDAKDVGLIKMKGNSWMYFDFLKNHKKDLEIEDKEWNEELMIEIGARANGAVKTSQALKENNQWKEWLEQDLYDALS